MVEVRTVSEDDLVAFRHLHNQYVDRKKPLSTVHDWYTDHPELLVGAYLDGDLIGHCLGMPMTDTMVELSGIAVTPPYRRQGIGENLLRLFEERAATLGFERVTLGSAGGYVDEFYIENGYTPASILVRVDLSDRSTSHPDHGYTIAEEKIINDTKKLYVEVDGYNSAELDAVREIFNDPEAIYIMEKPLVGQS